MSAVVSVAMATFNGAKYLQAQLDTISQQTVRPYELVVCDDGSTDDTVAILEDFAAGAPFPVRIVVNEVNLGFANNFLKCAALCTGNWIAFCDQDDIWLPGKIETLDRAIAAASPQLVLVYHQAELVDEDLVSSGRRLPLIQGDYVASPLSHPAWWFVGGCVMCFNRSLIERIDSSRRPKDSYRFNKGWSGNGYPWMPHDKWICLLANVCGEIAGIEKVLGLYRRHAAAETGSHKEVGVGLQLTTVMSTGADDYSFLAERWRETAVVLRVLYESCDEPARKQRLLDGAEAFEEASMNFSNRSNLYLKAGLLARLRRFHRLISARVYSGRVFSSIGYRAFFKDLVTALGLIRN